jgi:hypothetical protein
MLHRACLTQEPRLVMTARNPCSVFNSSVSFTKRVIFRGCGYWWLCVEGGEGEGSWVRVDWFLAVGWCWLGEAVGWLVRLGWLVLMGFDGEGARSCARSVRRNFPSAFCRKLRNTRPFLWNHYITFLETKCGQVTQVRSVTTGVCCFHA